MNRRVVISGVGLISPLGCNISNSWQRLINNEGGIHSTISRTDNQDYTSLHKNLPCKVAAYVDGWKIDDWVPVSEQGKMATFSAFAVAAATQAMTDAGFYSYDRDGGKNSVLNMTDEESERAGVCIGTGIGSLQHILETGNILMNQGYKKVSPYFVPRILLNIAAGHVSIKFKLKGPNHCAVTACATGAHCIGDAYRFIKYGDADVMVAGSAESCIEPISIAGFCRARALSTKYNDTPHLASRPFDRNRDGFVMGEGAGVMVLEEYEHAKRRGAKIYAEISGYGLSGDAYHITAASPDGNGALRAMQNALKSASRNVDEVDYINAHATSTPMGDECEHRAIVNLFKNVTDDHMKRNLVVSSTKGATGHLLGAAGAVEAIFTVLAIHHNVSPPTRNLFDPDDGFNLNYAANQACSSHDIRVALSNSFGFGGTNCSLLFNKL